MNKVYKVFVFLRIDFTWEWPSIHTSIKPNGGFFLGVNYFTNKQIHKQQIHKQKSKPMDETIFIKTWITSSSFSSYKKNVL